MLGKLTPRPRSSLYNMQFFSFGFTFVILILQQTCSYLSAIVLNHSVTHSIIHSSLIAIRITQTLGWEPEPISDYD